MPTTKSSGSLGTNYSREAWAKRLGRQKNQTTSHLYKHCETSELKQGFLDGKMPKPVNCCVPGCTNNFRNSEHLHYYRIPKDSALRAEYNRLIRNETLKLESENTRICSEHFEGGNKLNRKHLPSIFPWTKQTVKRREIEKIELPIKAKRAKKEVDISADREALEVESESSSTTEIETQTELTSKEMATQTDEVYFGDPSRIEELELSIKRLENELTSVKFKYENSKFNIDEFKDKPEDIAFYTGFTDYETLMLCFEIIEESANNLSYGNHCRKYNDMPHKNQPGRPRKLSKFQEFTMVVMKLRLGIFNRDLAHRFKVSENTVSLIFRTWIRFLRAELEGIIRLPSREVLQLHMPPLFKTFYPRTALIIDCTEFEMERPSALDNQSACYSSYKSRTTMKSLIGITPSGATAFVSELYPGSTSDKEIVKKSGLLELLQPGDEIMADKGFLIQDELASVGATLTLPAFLKARKQFSKEEAEQNKKVACLRVHVERCMERIKNWHILDRKIPVTLSPLASDMIIVLSAFTNFLPPLIS